MMSHSFVGCLASVALLGLVAAASGQPASLKLNGFAEASPASQPAGEVSADWPCWRGPNHNGIAPSSPKLLDSWPKEGPKLLWKSGYIPSADGGWSSCAVAEGKVYAYYTGMVSKDGSPNPRPITAAFLRDSGWIEEAPADLVNKVEEARKSGWTKLWGRKPADREAFAKDFMAGLDPKVVEKYGEFIKNRMLCDWTFEFLTGVAQYKDKEFKSVRDLQAAVAKIKGYGDKCNGNPDAVANQAFKTGANAIDIVVCLDADTGKELWHKALLDETVRRGGGVAFGGSSTPAIANGKCYVLGVFGAYCLSPKEGAVVWEKKMDRDSGTADSSPLVWNGVLYCCPFGSPLSAFDAETGRLLWAQPAVAGQGSPVPWSHDGKACIIFSGTSGSGTYCVESSTGKVLWKIPTGSWTTPVVVGDELQIGASVPSSLQLYNMTPEKAELVWEKKGIFHELYTGSALVYQGHIYASADGSGRCIDLKTGDVNWTAKLWYCYCTPCLADGKVFGYDHAMGDGEDRISMWRPTPEKFELLGQFKPKSDQKNNFAHVVGLNFVTSPAIANGKLYVRMSDCIHCYDLTAAGNP